MRVVVTGATGLIGKAVADALRSRGDQVVALSRDERRGRERLGRGIEVQGWPEPTQAPPPLQALSGADAVIHLLGEPISQRWSEDVKRKVRDSRVLTTRFLVQALAELPDASRPRVLVSQSATGYYGPSDDRVLDERSPAGSGFLADVVVAWEREALAGSDRSRVVVTRTGVVISPTGGALEKMLPPFKLGVGGPIAGGRQYVPWIHLDDVAGALLKCVDDDRAAGPVNLTAPNPVTNGELSRALGHAVHRPAVLPVPSLALKLLYGEMAQIVLTGARVVPAALEAQGYQFRFAQIEPALRDVLQSS